ncbi:MAG: prepilin-type N-terminal cleavage/methylation domain-containing protein [bacterium]|nr:prepilin-type N-terminal cleavage/methylation domain-containing protein [bacterium]
MQNLNSKSTESVRIDNQKGFTLIELISVLIILGVVASVAVKKLDLLSDNASITALRTGVRELKSRETITWFDKKLSGYTSDLEVYNAIDKNMGQGISWNPGPDISGGRLHLKSVSVDLIRIPSTVNSPGTWN